MNKNMDASSVIKRRKQAVLSGFKANIEQTVTTRTKYQNPSNSLSYVTNSKVGGGECCNGYPNSCGQSSGNYHECAPGCGCGN
jgi:hypothetical protein